MTRTDQCLWAVVSGFTAAGQRHDTVTVGRAAPAPAMAAGQSSPRGGTA
jgi:hypothetical protein